MSIQNHIKTNIFKLGISIGVSALLLGGLFYFMIAGVESGERPGVVGLMRQTGLDWLAGYLFLTLVQTFFRALRYRLLLAASKVAPLPGLFRMVLVTQVRNMFVDMLPARLGELTYVAMMRLGCNVAGTHGVSSLVVSFVFDLIALCAVMAGIWAFQASVSSPEPAIIAGCIVLAATLPILLVFIFSGFGAMVRAARRWLPDAMPTGWVSRSLDFAEGTSQALRSVRRAGIFSRVLVLSMALRIAKYTGLFCLFQGITRPSIASLARLPVAEIFSALLSAEAAASLPLPSFMGFGAYELAGSMALTVFGAAKDTAGLVMLSLHIWSQLIDYTLGGCALILFIWLYRRPTLEASRTRRSSRHILGALVMCFVAAGIALTAWQYRQFRKLGALVPPNAGHALARRSSESEPRPSYAQIKGFVVWSSNRSGNHDIWQMTLPDKTLKRLTRHPHTEYFPRVSPDGRRLVFSRSRKPWVSQRNPIPWDLVMLDLETGQETLLAEWANTPSWSSSGDHIFFQRNGNQVVALEWATGRESVKFATGMNDGPPASVMLSLPAVSPDLSRLAVTFVKGLRAVALYYPDGRWQKVGDGCQLNWGPDGAYLYDVTKGGRQVTAIHRIDPKTLKRHVWLDSPGEYSHEYFPKVSNNGDWLVYGASSGGHEHDTADYEIFLWKIDDPPDRALRMTHHSGNDCWPDIFIRGQTP